MKQFKGTLTFSLKARCASYIINLVAWFVVDHLFLLLQAPTIPTSIIHHQTFLPMLMAEVDIFKVKWDWIFSRKNGVGNGYFLGKMGAYIFQAK